MAAIKKFFEKTKLELKFKKAGEGHKLTASTKKVDEPRRDVPISSRELTDERKKAAEAALARSTQTKEIHGKSKATSSMKAAILAEKKEMETAIAQAKKYSSSPKEVNIDASPIISGIYFRCPSIGSNEILSEKEMESRIEEFLYSQLPEEPQLTSILMIHSLNKHREELKACIETLTKYLTNIIENPTKESYRRIKSSNKYLNERVLSCKGSSEFLQALGFEKKYLKLDDGEDEFYILQDVETNKEEEAARLREVLDALQACEPIRMELDRNIKVFAPSHKDATKFEVPTEFYALTSEELKREQKIREEATKDLEQLKTKDMREREKQRESRKYRYSAIRVRFPDGFMIQGTFGADESFASVRQFVLECIELDWIPFNLSTSVGHKIVEDTKTIAELNLAPASLLQFSFDQTILKEIFKQNNEMSTNKFLKDDLLILALEI